ncbi:hypothetical protein E8P82_01600 [Arthrobacter echini]|uniref:Uncharacterized protein n=1 Tax=Arthrobacter echini TaxID=1529066 RepID=A0A4S5EAM9_9MICC|nr:hypothetical protein [Arthrobacter echini]THJ68795.1 hypothetical protein E8P82_01600 [Arthrobacter echini]
MILVVIIACEIGFWVLIIAGLMVRYLLGKRRAGLVLLALTPLVDLILLTATVLDLRAGATATFVHGLAAVYLGISIAYGHRMIDWADARFAHRFGGGPRPTRHYGTRYAQECWKDVVRTIIAVLIAAGFLQLLTVLVDDAARTEALTGFYPILGIVFVVDLLWAVSYTIWPRKQPLTA